MIDLKPLLTFLRIVSLLGMLVMVSMMTAVLYKKLKEKYPVQVQRHKWVFYVVAGLMNILMFFLYQKFIVRN